MGYELKCDEHWEVGQKTLDMGKWKTIQTTLGFLVWIGVMLNTNHVEHTESLGHDTDRRELDLRC